MEPYVIDFQAFKTPDNNFLIKELCIVGVRSNVCVHAIVKPNVQYENLCIEMRCNVHYLTKYFHGIPWTHGYVNWEDTLSLLQNTVHNASVIYIKGSERATYIRSLCKNITVIDLDTLGCPRASPTQMHTLHCPYVKHKYNYTRYACSFRNANIYRDWIRCRFKYR